MLPGARPLPRGSRLFRGFGDLRPPSRRCWSVHRGACRFSEEIGPPCPAERRFLDPKTEIPGGRRPMTLTVITVTVIAGSLPGGNAMQAEIESLPKTERS